MKFLRRKLSEINRETARRSDTVLIRPTALNAYTAWIDDIKSHGARTITTSEGRVSFTMWSDASMVGWGCVLINNITQQVHIIADKWTVDEQTLHINILEARAMRHGLEKFDSLAGAAVNPMVDNTSVGHTAGKGHSKSQDLNEEIRAVNDVLARRDIMMHKPSIIKSADNISDHWSRHFDGLKPVPEIHRCTLTHVACRG